MKIWYTPVAVSILNRAVDLASKRIQEAPLGGERADSNDTLKQIGEARVLFAQS